MTTLRSMVAEGRPVLAPLVLNPMMARMAERAGFRALYLGGGASGYANVFTEANLTLTEMCRAGPAKQDGSRRRWRRGGRLRLHGHGREGMPRRSGQRGRSHAESRGNRDLMPYAQAEGGARLCHEEPAASSPALLDLFSTAERGRWSLDA